MTLSREPVALAAVVAAVAVLAARLGIDLTDAEQNAVTVLATVAAAWWARSKVTPVQ